MSKVKPLTLEQFMETGADLAGLQWSREYRKLRETLYEEERDPKLVENKKRVVDAVLSWRQLSESQRYAIAQMWYAIDCPSRYDMLKRIMDPENFTTVPKDLDYFLAEANYDLNDDGFLRVVRIEHPYMAKIRGTMVGDPWVEYVMTGQEWLLVGEAARKLEGRGSMFADYTVTKMTQIWFDDYTLDKFAGFLELLANPDNFDYTKPMSGFSEALDKFFDWENAKTKWHEWKDET